MTLLFTHSDLEKILYELEGKHISFSQEHRDSIRISHHSSIFPIIVPVYADFRIVSFMGSSLILNYFSPTGIGRSFFDVVFLFQKISGVYHHGSGLLEICIDEIPQAKHFLQSYVILDIRFVGKGVQIYYEQK